MKKALIWEILNNKEVSMRDKVLVCLKISSVMNVQQLKKILKVKASQISRVLTDLQTQKKIKGYRTSRAFKGYMLTKFGNNYVETKFPELINNTISTTEKQLQHKLSVVDNLVAAITSAYNNINIEWIDEKQSIYKKDKTILMRNDARMVMDDKMYWIEQDMGTQAMPVLKKKFRNIAEVIEELQKENLVKNGARKLPLDVLVISTNLEYLSPPNKEVLPICGDELEDTSYIREFLKGENDGHQMSELGKSYLLEYEINDLSDFNNLIKGLSPNNQIKRMSDGRKNFLERAVLNNSKDLKSLYNKMLYQNLKIYIASNYELSNVYKNIRASSGLVLSLFDKKDLFADKKPVSEIIHINFLTTGFLEVEAFQLKGYNLIVIDYDYCLSDRLKLKVLLDNVYKEMNCVVIVISRNYKTLNLSLPNWHDSLGKLRKNVFYCFLSNDFKLYGIQGNKICLLEDR